MSIDNCTNIMLTFFTGMLCLFCGGFIISTMNCMFEATADNSLSYLTWSGFHILNKGAVGFRNIQNVN